MENENLHSKFDVTDVDAEMRAEELNKKPSKFPEGTGDVPLLDSDLLEDEEDDTEKLDESDMLEVEDDK